MRIRPESGEDTRLRFVFYSIYAWGTPLLITSVTAFMEFLPSSFDKEGLILPGFGLRGCWFQGRETLLPGYNLYRTSTEALDVSRVLDVHNKISALFI